jgi:orotate phosphoribosyltransferase-like protein
MLLNNIYELRLLFKQLSGFFCLPSVLDNVSAVSGKIVAVVIELILAGETMRRKIKNIYYVFL